MVRSLRDFDAIQCISRIHARIWQNIAGEMPNLRILPLVPPTLHDGVCAVPRSTDGDERVAFMAPNVSRTMKGGRLLEQTFGRLKHLAQKFVLRVYDHNSLDAAVPSVEFKGRYQLDELDAIARQVDYCIVPSLCFETLGFVGLEMMARGVPLVVSSRAGVSEYVEHGRTGLVFDPANEAEFLALLTDLIGKPDQRTVYRAQVASQGAELKRFAQHVTEMETLFRNLLPAESI